MSTSSHTTTARPVSANRPLAGEGSSAPAPTPWGLVILLGAMTGFAPMGIDLYLPGMKTMEHSLAAPPGSGQATLAAFLAGMAVGQFAYGPASDRFGRRIPIFVGALIFTLASAACALATTMDQLVVARFIQALGGCAGGVVSRAVVRDRFSHTETARMLSLMMLIMGVAPIVAPLLGGWLLLAGGWRLLFWVLAAFGVVVGVSAYRFLGESRSEATAAQARAESPVRAYVAIVGSRRLIGYVTAGALNGAVLFTYISSSPDLIMGVMHFSPQVFGWLFGTIAVGIIGANQANRMLLRRLTPERVLAGASLIAVGFATLMLLSAVSGLGGPWLILALLFATIASYGFMQGNTMAGALSADPVRAGSVSALMGGASFGAGAVSSWLGGVLHDGTARPTAMVMLVALIGSALCLHLLALPETRRAHDQA